VVKKRKKLINFAKRVILQKKQGFSVGVVGAFFVKSGRKPEIIQKFFLTKHKKAI
jgi:hypothetical protein